MAKTVIPPPPAGFELESSIPAPPAGFVLDASNVPPPPDGFELEGTEASAAPPAVGTVRGLAASVQRGVKRAAGVPDVLLAAATKDLAKPRMRDERQAYVAAMNDPRYGLALAEDPARADALFGPQAKLDLAMSPRRFLQQFIAEDVAANEAAIAALPTSEAQQRLSAAESTGDKWAAWRKDPIELTASIALESLPPSIAGAIAGTAIGGPGVGTALGAGTSSGLLTFSSELLGSAGAAGYDVREPAQLQAFLNDAPAFDQAVNVALTKAGVIGPVDALTAGQAGRFIGPALKQGLGRTLLASGQELGMQAAGGAGGEAIAQLTSGQPLDSFDIGMEAMAELGSGPVEVAANLRKSVTSNQKPVSTAQPVADRQVFSEFGDEATTAPEPVAREAAAADVQAGTVETPTTGEQLNVPPPPAGFEVESPAPRDAGQTTVAEAPATIHAQITKLRRGKAPAVLFTPQDAVPDWALQDERFALTETPEGKVLYDTAALTADQIQQLTEAGRMGEVLGYGLPAKPAQPTGAIVVRDRAGLELRAVVVDDATAPAALKAAQQYAEEGDVVRMESLEEVLAKRLAATAPKETERQRMARENVEAMAELRKLKAETTTSGQPDDTAKPPQTITGSNVQRGTEMPVQPQPAAVGGQAAGGANIEVTEGHLQQAREAVAQMRGETVEQAATIFDDLDGVTRGPIRVPAELADLIDASRERIAQELHAKPWRRLSTAQRKAISKELRLSITEGFAANEALPGLGEKYAGLSVDDFANAILDAGEGRLLARKQGDSAEVKAMAAEIAAAEAEATEIVDDWDMAAAVAQAEAGIDEIQFREHIQPVAQQYGATPEQISTVFKEDAPAYQGELPLKATPTDTAGQSERSSDSLRTFSSADFARDFSDGRRIISAVDQSQVPSGVPTYNVNGTVINSGADFARTLMALRSPNNESIKVVILNRDNVVVHSEVLYAGTLDAGAVDLRDFIRLHEKHGNDGTEMVISHNHPSGNPSPSQADIEVTKRLQNMATQAGFRILDHIITNGGSYFSLRDSKEYKLDQYHQAPWEKVRRDQLREVNDSTTLTELVKTLRMSALPDTMHIIYQTTRGTVTAIERVPATTEQLAVTSHYVQKILRGVGREAAARIIIDFGPNTPGHIAFQITGRLQAMFTKGQPTTTRLVDYSFKGTISAAMEGYLQETPQGATVANQFQEDGKPRATGQKIGSSPMISDEVKAAITEYIYEPRTNRTDQQTADGILAQVGLETAIQFWRTATPTQLPGAVKSKLLRSITRTLAQEEQTARTAGQTLVAQPLARRQAELWDEALRGITNTAQELQALNDLVAMSPDGHVARARREVEKAGDKEVERHKGQTDAIRDALDEGRATGIKAVKQDAETNRAAREAVNEAIKNSDETRNAVVLELAGPWAQSEYILNHARAAVRAKADELLNRQPRPPGFTPAQHLRQILDDLASRAAGIFAGHIQGSEPGILLVDKLQQRLGLAKPEAVKLASQLSREWDKQLEAARKALDTRLAAARARQERREREPETNAALDRALRKQLRELNLKLGEAIRQAAADRQRTGEHMADRIVAASGLTGPAADALRAKLQARYDALTAEAQRRALEGIEKRSQVKISRTMRGAFDRLIEIDRLAAGNPEQFNQTVRTALKLPELTDAQAAELRQLVEEAQSKPEGWQQQRLMAKALTLVERAKGAYAWHDTAFAVWYAHIFSAPPTHLANMIGNTFKALEVLGIEMAHRPLAAGQILKAFAHGVESGALEAANVVLRGNLEGTRMLKAEAARPLEAKIQMGGWNRLWLPWATVGRLMAAEDVLFFKGHEEVRWQMLARRIAQQEGLRGEQLDARVQDLLHNSRAEYDAAKVQAATEGLSGLDLRRRAHEIIEQARERDMVGSTDQARRFALEHTFNSEPYGVMGALAEVLNSANRKLVVTRFAMPVVRIMANLANESLNYFPPVGLARVIVPKFRSDIVVRAGGDVDALAYYQARAIVGTVLFGALLAAMSGGGEDDEPLIDITGVGPRTKNQREQLRKTGWKPNAIRLGSNWYSYQETQLAIPLAILGNYGDAIKYKGMTEDDAANRAAYTAQMLINTILEQRMLSGVADLLTVMQPEGDGRQLGNFLSRAGSSFVVPNAARWVDQVFDPAVYEPDDVKGAIYRQTPWARRLNRPALNALGEPVERPAMDRFVSPEKPDALMRIIAAKNAWIPMPRLEDQTVGNPRLDKEYQRPMTPDEYYVWIAESGPEIRRRLTENLDVIAGLPAEEAQAYVRQVTNQERAKYKPQ